MGADRVGANPLAEGGWVKPFGGWLGGADFQHLRDKFFMGAGDRPESPFRILGNVSANAKPGLSAFRRSFWSR